MIEAYSVEQRPRRRDRAPWASCRRRRADGAGGRAASPTSSPSACASGHGRRVVAARRRRGQRRRRPVRRRPRSPRRAWPPPWSPSRSTRTRPGWPRLTDAGGRGRRPSAATATRAPTSWSPRPTSSLDGILGIGGRPGLPPSGRGRWCGAVPDDVDGHRRRPAERVDPAGGDLRAVVVFADETVTFGVAKPVHLLPATEPAVRACSPWSTSGSTVDRAGRASSG